MRKVLIPIDWSDNAEWAFDSKPKEIEHKEAQMLELQEVYETRLLQLKIDHFWITHHGTNPGEHIVKEAREQNVDMIVMGARGLGKLKRTILGGVSDHVLSKAHVPVLICKVT